jgi:hypothetical protein
MPPQGEIAIPHAQNTPMALGVNDFESPMWKRLSARLAGDRRTPVSRSRGRVGDEHQDSADGCGSSAHSGDQPCPGNWALQQALSPIGTRMASGFSMAPFYRFALLYINWHPNFSKYALMKTAAAFVSELL